MADRRWIVGVGASGGAGLQDLQAFLAAWPAASRAAIMVVLHRAPDRPSRLREVLQRASGVPVVIAEQGALVCPGVCYLGEPAGHLTLDPLGRVDLTPDAVHRHRTIDLLFHSLAANAAPSVIGVILSGSLDDGSRGLAAIDAAGGATMVISPDGAYGGDMPENAVARCGGVDFRGSPAQLATQIGKLIELADVGA